MIFIFVIIYLCNYFVRWGQWSLENLGNIVIMQLKKNRCRLCLDIMIIKFLNCIDDCNKFSFKFIYGQITIIQWNSLMTYLSKILLY